MYNLPIMIFLYNSNNRCKVTHSNKVKAYNLADEIYIYIYIIKTEFNCF